MLGVSQLLAFFSFFVINNFLLNLAKPNLTRFVVEKRKLEGVYRADHSRIHHFCEEIAFVRGEKRERELIEDSLDALVQQGESSLFTHFWKDILDSYVLKYGGNMLAYTIIIPSLYFNWHGLKGQEATQHYLESTALLLGLGGAVKDIMSSSRELAKLEGLTKRVYDILEALTSRVVDSPAIESRGVVIRDETIDYIEFENCDVIPPHLSFPTSSVAISDEQSNENEEEKGKENEKEELEKEKEKDTEKGEDGAPRMLVQNLSLRINQGEHLLVSGPNGIGKSSLFRVMASLWPLTSGTLRLPPVHQLYFISQNAYMIPGNLSEQITYPQCFSSDEIDQREGELRELLRMVDLEHLLSRYTLKTTEQWQRVLSGGEKQRLVIARLYFHRPLFGVLDECTSQISLEMEHRVFSQAKTLGITLITIAHNAALKRHHARQLSLLGDGKWSVQDLTGEGEGEKQEAEE